MEHVINGASDGDDDAAMTAHIEDLITTYDLYSLPDKTVIKTHGPAQCGNYEGGEYQICALHNPTEHHMREWPAVFRLDKLSLLERTCEHGVGHPDPDSLEFFVRSDLAHVGVHGCDGCCKTAHNTTSEEAA